MMMLRKPFHRRISLALALALLLAWLPGSSEANELSSTASNFSIERIARTGDPVPGIEGAAFTSVFPGYSAIDGAGNVIFWGIFDDGDGRGGFFFGQPDDYELLMELLEPAIGFDDPSMVYQAFRVPNLAEDGTLAVEIQVGDIRSPSGTPNLYTGQPDQLEVTMYEDGPAPGYPDGAFLLNFNLPDINALGQIATWADVELADGARLDTILAGDPHDLNVVAEGGGAVPGVPGATFVIGKVPSVGGLTYNDLGWVGFSAEFEGEDIDETNDLGMFAGAAGDVILVARTGSQAPGLEDGVHFSLFWEVIPTNALGNVAFLGYVQGPGIDGTNDQGLWYGARDDLALILREAEQAPGLPEGVVFDVLDILILHNGPNVLVKGYLEGPGITNGNDEGQWYGSSQGFDLLIQEGQQAPGLDEGIVITFDGGGELDDPWIITNDPGDLLMLAPLSGPGVTAENEVAVYFRDANDDHWQLVLRFGDELDGLNTIANGPNPTWIALGSGATGSPRSFNDAGVFSLYVDFEDEISGMYRITPLPDRRKAPDWDSDGDVDLVDFARFQECFSHSSSECLEHFDLDHNGAIDLEDFSLFQSSVTGPEQP